ALASLANRGGSSPASGPPPSSAIDRRTCRRGDVDRSGSKRLRVESIGEVELASCRLVAKAQRHELAGPYHTSELGREGWRNLDRPCQVASRELDHPVDQHHARNDRQAGKMPLEICEVSGNCEVELYSVGTRSHFAHLGHRRLLRHLRSIQAVIKQRGEVGGAALTQRVDRQPVDKAPTARQARGGLGACKCLSQPPPHTKGVRAREGA